MPIWKLFPRSDTRQPAPLLPRGQALLQLVCYLSLGWAACVDLPHETKARVALRVTAQDSTHCKRNKIKQLSLCSTTAWLSVRKVPNMPILKEVATKWTLFHRAPCLRKCHQMKELQQDSCPEMAMRSKWQTTQSRPWWTVGWRYILKDRKQLILLQ